MRLKNKVSIITGGGSGFGRASAYLFAKEGAKVVVTDICDVSGEETVTKINELGREAIFVHTDVIVASEVQYMNNGAVDKFGEIDVLFNNAGIGQKVTPVVEVEESVWDNIYAVNVKSIFLATKYVVPLMKKAGGGVIINTGSVAGIRPGKKYCAYASSKAAVIHLTKALAAELAEYNIRVNCINPTVADTPLIRFMFNDETLESVVKAMPLGRLAKPEDVAYAALFLASEDSAMLTGSCINPDGGRSI